MSEAKLSEYDFVVVFDVSGSMEEPTRPGGPTRWSAMQESIMTLIRDVEKLDSDGIDLVQLGGQGKSWTGVTSDKAREIFAGCSPRGGTPLHAALESALGLAGKSAKKDFIVVYTDGVPDDQTAAAKVIKDAANKQTEDDALTILFIQVGDDRNATAFLKSLDDNLKGAKFDIVDTKTVEEVDKFQTSVELIMAAIND